MKTIPCILLAAALGGCITAPDGTTRLDTVAVNSLAALAVDLAAQHFGVSPDSARAIRTGANDLFGVAAQAQASLGKTPSRAAVAQGAALPEIGKAVQAALPNAPLNQQTVNAIFEAAEKTKTINAAP